MLKYQALELMIIKIDHILLGKNLVLENRQDLLLIVIKTLDVFIFINLAGHYDTKFFTD